MVVTVGELAVAVYAGRHPQRLPGRSNELRERAIVNQRDVNLRIAAPADLDVVAVPASPEVERLALKEGDVLLTSRGVVRVALVEREHVGAIPAANLIVVRLRDGLMPSLLAAYLSDPRIEAALLRDFAGSTIPGFSVEAVRRLEIQLPTNEKQDELSELVRATDEYEQSILRAIEIRRTISQELVFRAFQSQI